jgi:hypothetical protein
MQEFHYQIVVANRPSMRQSTSITADVPCWREEILISTHLRFAAGICLLSTGLLIGSAGGGIAAADTDAGGSTSQSQDADGGGPDASPASGSVTSAPAANAASTFQKTLRETIQSVVTNTLLGSLAKPGQPQAGIPEPPVAKPDTTEVTDVKDAKEETETTTLVSTAVTSASGDVVSTSKLGSDRKAAEPKTTLPVSVSSVAPPAFDRAAVASKVAEPIANAVVTVLMVAQSVPGLLAALPMSPTPIADVITALQSMLTTVGDAFVPLVMQVPSDLFTLLVAPGESSATTGVIGRSHALGSFTTIVAPGPPSPLPPQALPIPALSAIPFLADGAAPVTVADVQMAALSHDFAISGAESVAPASAGPGDVKSFLEHTIDAILVPASLSALAALALPGLAGLLIACAAGMRVGYRQAKAAMAARKSGIARFAGTGPLGVVRSGAMIALRRPRPPRGAHSRPSAARRFQQVA